MNSRTISSAINHPGSVRVLGGPGFALRLATALLMTAAAIAALTLVEAASWGAMLSDELVMQALFY
jgi:hypothetical protein